VNHSTSAPLPDGYPGDLERTWLAADGTRVLLRALRPDDIDREIAFIAGLSSETLYQRVHFSGSGVNRRDEARRLLDLDYVERCAIGALIGAPPGDAIIGVSRYAMEHPGDTAECAIVVTDAWQGRGLGTELMRSLGVAARRHGVRWLTGSSLADNQRIHEWARRMGFAVRTSPNAGGQVQITVDLESLPS
jgi:acetyltransferase